MVFHSKQQLHAKGYLAIDFTFQIMEEKSKKSYFTHGTSKVTNDVKKNRQKIMEHAIWNGVKKVFPTGSVTPYNIIVMSYDIVYLASEYQVISKENKKGKVKYYEQYKEDNKVKESLISPSKEYKPDQRGYNR